MAEVVTIARPYAVAAFRLAKEKGTLTQWSEMLAFAAAVVADAQMQALIDDPKLSGAEVEKLFLTVCGDKLNEQGANLVKLLVEYDRLNLLPVVAEIFAQLKDQEEGTLEAVVTAAVQLDDKQMQKIVDQLQTRFGKKVEASLKIDPEIIGGIKIIVGDTVIDASVQGRLQELAYTLKG